MIFSECRCFGGGGCCILDELETKHALMKIRCVHQATHEYCLKPLIARCVGWEAGVERQIIGTDEGLSLKLINVFKVHSLRPL